MGTRFNLLLPGIDPQQGEELFVACTDELNRLENMLSCFKDDSEISVINRQAHKNAVEVDAELFGILKDCQDYYELSGGAFDISLGKLFEQWKSGSASNEYEYLYQETGFDKIVLDSENKTVRFTSPYVKLDLGGYGKGYALNKLRHILINKGVASALISFGESSIWCIGTHPYGEYWPIGIPDHFDKDRIIETLKLNNEAVSTSGNLDSPGHIIDPANGIPVKGKKMYTVKSGNAISSEVLSTAMMIMDEETRNKMLLEIPGIEILEVNYKDKKAEVLTYSSEK